MSSVQAPSILQNKDVGGGRTDMYSQKKIIIPPALQGRIITWYHEYLAHPGETRLEATLRQLFDWGNMRKHVQRHVKTCRTCQVCKQKRKKYGKLPAKVAENARPWDQVNVDMIRPLTVKAQNGTFQLRALTMIDPATGWFESEAVNKVDAETVSAAFDDAWLCRYPRPQYMGYDGGSEFKSVFDEMRANFGMKKKISTPYNPQSNGVIERVHQVLNDAIRTFELSK